MQSAVPYSQQSRRSSLTDNIGSELEEKAKEVATTVWNFIVDKSADGFDTVVDFLLNTNTGRSVLFVVIGAVVVTIVEQSVINYGKVIRILIATIVVYVVIIAAYVALGIPINYDAYVVAAATTVAAIIVRFFGGGLLKLFSRRGRRDTR